MISESILQKYGARKVELEKGEILFQEGDPATHFLLVDSGRIKMSSSNDQGREFVKGYFTEGQSFGELPPERKHELSHRGRAVRALVQALRGG